MRFYMAQVGSWETPINILILPVQRLVVHDKHCADGKLSEQVVSLRTM